jgi:CHRD domain-containing protein
MPTQNCGEPATVMRRTVVCAFLATCLWQASAQETLQFTAYLNGMYVVPVSSTPYDGTGSFLLTGNSLSYEVVTDPLSGFRGNIYGPAGPGVNGEPLFGLGIPFCIAPGPDREGYCKYQGEGVLTDEQIGYLNSGLLYVQLASTAFPELAMRGQIMAVPEPSVSFFGSIGALLLMFRRKIKKTVGPRLKMWTHSEMDPLMVNASLCT